MPTYNGSATIAGSLRSILDQDFDDLEVIVSDNASTDDTVAIVTAIAEHDPRVLLVTNPTNRGAAQNYNETVSRARGKYFTWQADDDECEPSFLSRCVAELEAHPDAVLAHPWTRVINDDRVIERELQDNLHIDSADPIHRLRRAIANVRYCNEVFGVISTDVLRRSAQIAPFPGSDNTLLLELSLHGKFVVVPEYLFLRRPGRSIPANRSAKAIAQWFDTSRRGPTRAIVLHHARANIAAVRRAPLSGRDKGRALWVLAVKWVPQYARRVRRRRRRGEFIRG